MKPYLKWAGGKRTIAKPIRHLFELSGATRLVEPFCGALSIALELNAPEALLADNNEHLINLHHQIKVSGKFPDMPKENNKDFYLGIREAFNGLTALGKQGSRESAMYFYYMNRTGFNGLCRFNKKNFFNVGWGKYKNPQIFDDFSDFSKRFETCTFKCQPFLATLAESRKYDFLFIDPPYDGTFTGYTQSGFKWEDQVSLAEAVSKLEAQCVITNSKTERLIKLYKGLGFVVCEHEMPRKISCNGNRAPAIELMVFHNCSEVMIKSATENLKNFKVL